MQSFTVSNRRYINSSDTPTGRIVARNCRFEKARKNGVLLAYKPYSSIEVGLDNCVIEGCGTDDPQTPDVGLSHIGSYNEPTDGAVFRNVTICQSANREWISRDGVPENPTAAIGHIRGNITIESPSRSTRKLTLNPDWCVKNFPQKTVPPTLPRTTFGGKATVVDACPGEAVELSTLRVRGIGNWLFHAPSAGAALSSARRPEFRDGRQGLRGTA